MTAKARGYAPGSMMPDRLAQTLPAVLISLLRGIRRNWIFMKIITRRMSN